MSSQISWKRVGGALLAIVLIPLIAGDAILLLNYQLAPWRYAQASYDIYPSIDSVPVALADKSLSNLPERQFGRFGLSFQLPWEDVSSVRTFDDEMIVVSKSAGSFSIYSPDSSHDSMWLLRTLAVSKSLNALGPHPSNYALLSEAMSAKAADVKWWKGPRQNSDGVTLLMLKLLTLECQGPLYTVSSGEMRGFQQGSLSTAPFCVKLDILDSADRHYKLVIRGGNNKAAALSQAQINAILASIRSVYQS